MNEIGWRYPKCISPLLERICHWYEHTLFCRWKVVLADSMAIFPASRLFRLAFPSNRLVTIAITMCFFNSFLFFLQSSLHRGYCNSERRYSEVTIHHKRSLNDVKSENDTYHWKTKEKNEYWMVEMAKYTSFNWEVEMERLMNIIPALEIRTHGGETEDVDPYTRENTNNAESWGQGLSKSPVLPLVTERVAEDKIAHEVRRINRILWEQKEQQARQNTVEDRTLDHILGCEEIEKMERGHAEHRIKYTFRSVSHYKGIISLSNGGEIPIKVKRYQMKKLPPQLVPAKANYLAIARNQSPYFDKGFEHAKNDVLNLLRMHEWYGTPRLIGLCVTSSNGDDLLKYLSTLKDGDVITPFQKKASIIRYITSRHDDGVQMCDTYYASEECQRLHPIMSMISNDPLPTVASLTVMLNTARLFEQFWKNRAVLYEFQATELYVSSKFEVTITDVSTVKFLPRNEYSQNSNIQRLLSGTICVTADQCAPVSWGASTISYKLGLQCLEVRGYCTPANRCWGIDSHTHACIISRWFFGRLHSIIPVSWSRDGDLSRLLRCATRPQPEERCNWTQLRSGLEEMLESTRKETSEKRIPDLDGDN